MSSHSRGRITALQARSLTNRARLDSTHNQGRLVTGAAANRRNPAVTLRAKSHLYARGRARLASAGLSQPSACGRAGSIFEVMESREREDQAWFWTERWQAMEREADADIEAGRVTVFETTEEFLEHLDRLTGFPLT
jgi:hypothetical protein